MQTIEISAPTPDQEDYLRKIEQASTWRSDKPCPQCGEMLGDHIIGGPGSYHPKPKAE